MIQKTIKSIFTISLVSLCTLSHGQQLEVDIAEKADIQIGYRPTQIVKTEDGKFIGYATAPPMFGTKYKDLLTFPSVSKEETTVEIKVPFEKTYSYNFLENTKRMVRIIVQKDKKGKKIKKYFQEFDAKGNQIDVIEYESTPYGKYNDLPIILTNYSDDNSMALIYDNYDEDKKKIDFKGGFTVVNSDLEVIQQYLYEGEGSQKMNTMEFFNIGNNGDFSFLIKKYKGGKAKEVIKEGKVKVPGYEYVLGIKKKDSPLEEIEIDLDNAFVRGGAFTTNNEGDFILFFPYNSDAKEETAIGFHTIHVDKDTREIKKNSHAFTNDELDKFGTWKKSDPGLDEKFAISPFTAKNENQIAFGMERINPKQIQAGFSMQHMSIICFKVDNDGIYQNYLHVPKCFSAINSYNMAQFKYFNDQLYVIYNDNKKNIDKNLSEYAKMKSTWSMKNDQLYYAYDKNGTVQRKLMSESLDGGLMYAGSSRLETDKMVIPYLDISGDDKGLKLISLSAKTKE